MLIALMVAAPAQGALNDTIFVSRATGPHGAASDQHGIINAGGRDAISADGRYVVFQSEADHLSTQDNNDVTNVFVRDLVADTTTLVSRADGPTGDAADGSSNSPTISADGRFVAFSSEAGNLSAEDPMNDEGGDAFRDIFVRDLQTNTTTLASRASGLSGEPASGGSSNPSISGDGRFVVFQSDADNLSTEDNDAVANIFVRDLQTGATIFVSRADGVSGAAADAPSLNPKLSNDGRFVLFTSGANNLSADDNDAFFQNIYVRDVQTGTTTFVNRSDGPNGASSNLAPAGEPAISGNGRYVAFASQASNLDPDDTDTFNDVFVRDLQAATTTLVTPAEGPTDIASQGANFNPSISDDGRFVAFNSTGDSLSTEDNNDVANLFVRDLQTNTITYVNRASGANGAPGDGDAGAPSISGNGRFVAFHSSADSLSPEDTDGFTLDVFVRDLSQASAIPPVVTPRKSYPVPPRDVALSAFADCPSATANVIRGTAASNSIVGTRFADRIFAGTGNDTVDGLAANDCIDLGPGTDRGQGGAGNDLVVGGLGVDRMAGNEGNDSLRGGASADRLIGGFGNDTLHGQSGSDRVNGERGRDRINGGSANDVISAGSSNDRAAGDQGNDRINGNSGNDSIRGNSGRDKLKGSSGRDRLSGGSGNDSISARDGQRDRINCGSGRDKVSADRIDRVSGNCERVSRRTAGRS